MIEPRPAATVMIARDSDAGIEVFMLRRSTHSPFMPDVFVFPGGAVDEADRDPVTLASIRGSTQPLDPAYVYAAARETFEEAGLLFCADSIETSTLHGARQQLLARTATFAQLLAQWNIAVDAAAFFYFSRWITPPSEGRRFDARFFVARSPAGQTAEADAVETHDGIWIAPSTALAYYATGEFALIFPTIKHLERLRAFESVDELLTYATQKPIHPVMPIWGENQEPVVPPMLEDVW